MATKSKINVSDNKCSAKTLAKSVTFTYLSEKITCNRPAFDRVFSLQNLLLLCGIICWIENIRYRINLWILLKVSYSFFFSFFPFSATKKQSQRRLYYRKASLCFTSVCIGAQTQKSTEKKRTTKAFLQSRLGSFHVASGHRIEELATETERLLTPLPLTTRKSYSDPRSLYVIRELLHRHAISHTSIPSKKKKEKNR